MGKRLSPDQILVAHLDRLIPACAHDRAAVLDALIEAGELESAMTDAGADAASAPRITDALASTLCTGDPDLATGAAAILNRINIPGTLSVSPPEGFTYYALHPLDFANVLARIPTNPGSVQ